jgi:hypothetical protein
MGAILNIDRRSCYRSEGIYRKRVTTRPANASDVGERVHRSGSYRNNGLKENQSPQSVISMPGCNSFENISLFREV